MELWNTFRGAFMKYGGALGMKIMLPTFAVLFVGSLGYYGITGKKLELDSSANASTIGFNDVERCGDRTVDVQDPDTFPGQPQLTEMLKSHPCFNYGWQEKNGVHVINYIGGNSGGRGVAHPHAKELVNAVRARMQNQDMEQAGRLLNALLEDGIERVAGPRTLAELKKSVKASGSTSGKVTSNHQYWTDVELAINLIRVAQANGLVIKLSDAVQERNRADKLPGDFLMKNGTADHYKLILARMAPSNWEKWQMEYNLAGTPKDAGDIERIVALEKKAISYLNNPDQIKRAIERLKRGSPKTADRVLSELGLA